MTVLLVNFGQRKETIDLVLKDLPWTGPAMFRLSLVDSAHDLEPVHSAAMDTEPRRLAIEALPASVTLVKVAGR